MGIPDQKTEAIVSMVTSERNHAFIETWETHLMSTYQERLAKAMSESELYGTPTALANAIGCTPQAISLALSGSSKKLGATNHSKASELLGVRPSWLANEDGPMRGLINSPPKISDAASELVSLFFALDELEQKKLMAKLRYKVELLAIEEQKQSSQVEPKNKRASA